MNKRKSHYIESILQEFERRVKLISINKKSNCHFIQFLPGALPGGSLLPLPRCKLHGREDAVEVHRRDHCECD